MSFNTAQPYIASFIMLEKNGKYAFVKRATTGWMDGYFGLVAGKVEKNESFTSAAIREAHEEAGVTIARTDIKQVLTCHRMEADEPEMSWVDVVFLASKWQGEVINAEPKVHSELAWFALDELPENVVPSVRFMLEQIAAGNSYCEYGIY